VLKKSLLVRPSTGTSPPTIDQGRSLYLPFGVWTGYRKVPSPLQARPGTQVGRFEGMIWSRVGDGHDRPSVVGRGDSKRYERRLDRVCAYSLILDRPNTASSRARVAQKRLAGWTAGYAGLPGVHDEFLATDGKPCPHWLHLMLLRVTIELESP
jgi:hypothetical protein